MYLEQTLFLFFAIAAFLVARSVIYLRSRDVFKWLPALALGILPPLCIFLAFALALIRLSVLEGDYTYKLVWSAGSPEVIHSLFGVILGIMVSILVDLVELEKSYLRWSLATFVVLLVGSFYTQIARMLDNATSLESPLVSIRLQNETKPPDTVIQKETPGIIYAVNFSYGIDNSYRTFSLVPRDISYAEKLKVDNRHVKNIQNLHEFLKPFELCLRGYSDVFPDGLPLEQPLARLSTGLLALVRLIDVEASVHGERLKQMFGGIKEERKRHAQSIVDSVEEVRSQAKSHLYIYNNNTDFNPEACLRRLELSSVEQYSSYASNSLPYLHILAGHVMVAAGYTPSAVANLLDWVDKNANEDSTFDQLMKIRALTELVIILKQAGDYRGVVHVLWELYQTYEVFISAAFGVAHRAAVPLQGEPNDVCWSSTKHGVAQADRQFGTMFRSFMFGAVNTLKELAYFEAKQFKIRVAINNEKLAEIASMMLRMNIECFQGLFAHQDDPRGTEQAQRLRVEFLVAYAYTQLALADSREIVVAPDRVSLQEHLRHARAALDEALGTINLGTINLIGQGDNEVNKMSRLKSKVLSAKPANYLEEIMVLRDKVIAAQKRT